LFQKAFKKREQHLMGSRESEFKRIVVYFCSYYKSFKRTRKTNLASIRNKRLRILEMCLWFGHNYNVRIWDAYEKNTKGTKCSLICKLGM
jgi:hypothetical protein